MGIFLQNRSGYTAELLCTATGDIQTARFECTENGKALGKTPCTLCKLYRLKAHTLKMGGACQLIAPPADDLIAALVARRGGWFYPGSARIPRRARRSRATVFTGDLADLDTIQKNGGRACASPIGDCARRAAKCFRRARLRAQVGCGFFQAQDARCNTAFGGLKCRILLLQVAAHALLQGTGPCRTDRQYTEQ